MTNHSGLSARLPYENLLCHSFIIIKTFHLHTGSYDTMMTGYQEVPRFG
jgi:hypothetical protein